MAPVTPSRDILTRMLNEYLTPSYGGGRTSLIVSVLLERASLIHGYYTTSVWTLRKPVSCFFKCRKMLSATLRFSPNERIPQKCVGYAFELRSWQAFFRDLADGNLAQTPATWGNNM